MKIELIREGGNYFIEYDERKELVLKDPFQSEQSYIAYAIGLFNDRIAKLKGRETISTDREIIKSKEI